MILVVVDAKNNDNVSNYVGHKIFRMVRIVMAEAQEN